MHNIMVLGIRLPLVNSKIQLGLLHQLRTRQFLAKQGFTLVELMIVVAIIGLLSVVALPQFLGARDKADSKSRIGELIGLAKECATLQIDADNRVVPVRTPYGTTISCGGTVPVALSMSSQSWAASQDVVCLGSTLTAQTKVTIGIGADGTMSCVTG